MIVKGSLRKDDHFVCTGNASIMLRLLTPYLSGPKICTNGERNKIQTEVKGTNFNLREKNTIR